MGGVSSCSPTHLLFVQLVVFSMVMFSVFCNQPVAFNMYKRLHFTVLFLSMSILKVLGCALIKESSDTLHMSQTAILYSNLS